MSKTTLMKRRVLMRAELEQKLEAQKAANRLLLKNLQASRQNENWYKQRLEQLRVEFNKTLHELALEKGLEKGAVNEFIRERKFGLG